MFLQIDIIKPNLSELYAMVTACVKSNLIIENIEEIKMILRKRYDIEDEENKNKTDLKEILIISKAMYDVMNQSNQKDKNFKNLTFTGKHVLVTLGQRGVLWCGPGPETGIKNSTKNVLNDAMKEKATMKESEKEDNHEIIENGNKTVTYDFSSIFCGNDKTASWLHIPAVPFNVSTDATFPYVLNTNGAGDAFCAGFIRGILDNNNIENCIKLGLLSSHSKILFSSGSNPR